VFIANPSTAVEAGLRWVLPMMRTAEERELLALAMHELRSREAADRRRERRREEVRWAITTLVAIASLVRLEVDQVVTLAAEMERLGVATAGEIGLGTLADRVTQEMVANQSVIIGRAEIGAWSRV
jgi:hypothetical protein